MLAERDLDHLTAQLGYQIVDLFKWCFVFDIDDVYVYIRT